MLAFVEAATRRKLKSGKTNIMAPRSTTAAPAAAETPALATPTAGATGPALLAELANSENGELFMTQAEAAEGIAAGHFVADATRANGDRAPVKLTDAGFAAFQASNEGDNAQAEARQSAPASSGFEIEDSVAIPTEAGVRRGRSGGYPFEALQVGQSFHVAKSADNENPAERLASSVSGARAKYAVQDGDKTEEVTVKTYKKGEDGKYLKDAEGKRIVESEAKETRPVMKVTRDFIVRAVDATDPKGIGARVWRTA